LARRNWAGVGGLVGHARMLLQRPELKRPKPPPLAGQAWMAKSSLVLPWATSATIHLG
jgi:hypothetical protein